MGSLLSRKDAARMGLEGKQMMSHCLGSNLVSAFASCVPRVRASLSPVVKWAQKENQSPCVL